MAVLFERVQPGDLITSELFNRLLDEFTKLRDRVTVLEGTPSVGEVGIQSLIPTGGVVRPGDTLNVFGFGFGVSFGVCRVTIDETPVPDLKAGSNDRQLVFDIPAALESTIPVGGRPADLAVSGFRGSAHATLRLQPGRIIVQGGVEFRILGTTPGTILRPGTAVFNLAARSTANAAATLQLRAIFSEVANANQWVQQATFADANGVTLPNGRLTLAANEDNRHFRLVLASIPGADPAFQVAVSGATDDGLVSGQSEVRRIVIGTPPDPQDPDIEPAITLVVPERRVDGVLTLARGASATVTVRVRLKRTGTYTAAAPAFEGAGWTSGVTQPQALPAQALPPAGFVDRLVEFDVRAGNNPAATGRVTLRVQRDGAAVGTSVVLPLKVAVV